jgi:hypothetical protein
MITAFLESREGGPSRHRDFRLILLTISGAGLLLVAITLIAA